MRSFNMISGWNLRVSFNTLCINVEMYFFRWTANPPVPLISHQEQNVTSSSALERVFRIFQNCFTGKKNNVFVAVFLGCTSTGRVGLCFLWFYVQELPKAQLAVVLVLKRLRRRGNGLKSHPTDWEKPGIEPGGLRKISFTMNKKT